MTRPPVKLEKKPPTLARTKMVRATDDKKTYENKLESLQLRMLRIQQAYYHQQRRAVVVFEGWDAAGKGGAIRRVTEQLDPRGVQVHAIAAPSKEEQGKHYLYRFWQRLPRQGTIAIFDRSWYGRVLVEKVESFASKDAVQRAYDEINDFERLLLDDGVRLVKVFLHISKEEQLRRFAERLENPYKRWKLTDEDARNRAKWPDYVDAIDRMFARTSTTRAPWHVVGADWKWHARVHTLEILTEALAKDVDLTLPVVAPEALASLRAKLGIEAPKKKSDDDEKKQKSEKKQRKDAKKDAKRDAKKRALEETEKKKSKHEKREKAKPERDAKKTREKNVD